MKFNECWLRTWVDPDVTTEELSNQLTNAGLEVDVITSIRTYFKEVVICKVLQVENHPSANHLSVCRVDDGIKQYNVVCGAPNVHAGMLSAFAKIGTTLPNGFEIKERNIHGVQSQGMLCSGNELGFNEDANGILDLPEHFKVGADIADAYELNDVQFDLDLTPNRGDCFSIQGIAREVSVINEFPIKEPDIELVPAQSETSFDITLEDEAGCPCYLGRIIEDIDLSKSTPHWISERLRRSGLRSINSIVDISNYIMLELGQPMHVFDLDQLDSRIIVRYGRKDERLELLNSHEVTLDENTLIIADSSGPVAIAGVIGGLRSSVSEATTNLFLECAYFSPDAVRGTARRYDLATDAAARYERGVDFQLQHKAMERATQLLVETVGGMPGPIVEATADQFPPSLKTVRLRGKRLDVLVGERIPRDQITSIFARLGMDPVYRNDEWTVKVPSFRFDISIEEDLIEEILRIYGYSRVESHLPCMPINLRNVPTTKLSISSIRNTLVVLGYHEAITFSFVDNIHNGRLAPTLEAVILQNPISPTRSKMRTSLWPGLVEATQRNYSRQQKEVRLFEIGRCFSMTNNEIEQLTKVGGIVTGGRNPESWAHDSVDVDFFDIKGDVERLIALSGKSASFNRAILDSLHPGKSASIHIDDERIGYVGVLHPTVCEEYELDGNTVLFECDLDPLLTKSSMENKTISRFPNSRRDLAVVVNKDVLAKHIEDVARESAREFLSDITIFDVYTGEPLRNDEKSIGLGLTFQHPNKTLEDTYINERINATMSLLQKEFGARLRGGL